MISVGVDIGTYSIKIAEAESTSRSYSVRRVSEIPLSLDPSKDRKIQVIDALRSLFVQYDLDKTQFVFSMPQQGVSSRLFYLPFKERFKVQKAIISLLEDELPLSAEESVFEAKLLRLSGPGADVLAMAAPREKVLEMLNMGHDCGVEPSLISSDALALNNLFERWYEPIPTGLPPEQDIPAPKDAELILNIGHLGTDILVISQNVLLTTRHVDWGAKNMADAIGQRYGLNYVQAMRELQTKGFIILDKTQGSKEQLAFSQTIETSVQNLVGDLRLKILELQSEMNLTWTRGLIMGGASQLKNLNALLTQGLQIPFNRYRQFEHHPAITFDLNPQLEAVTNVAVGLALEGLKRPRNPAVNFLKGDLAKQGNFFEAVWEKWGYAAQVAGAAFVIFLIYAMLRDSLSLKLLEQSEQALKTQAQAVAGMNARQATPSKIRKFIKSQEMVEKSRKQAEKVLKMTSALDVLKTISSSLPGKNAAQLEIKRLSISKDQVEIHGYTTAQVRSETISRSLSQMAVGGTVTAINSRINTPTGMNPFSFKFKVQRISGG